jgi:hypothetical protein
MDKKRNKEWACLGGRICVVESIDLEDLKGELPLRIQTIDEDIIMVVEDFKVVYDFEESVIDDYAISFRSIGGFFEFEKTSKWPNPFNLEFYAEPYFRKENNEKGFVIMVDSHQTEQSFWDSIDVKVSYKKKEKEVYPTLKEFLW